MTSADGRKSDEYDKKTNHDGALARSGALVTMYIEDTTHYWQIGKYGFQDGEFWNIAAMDGETRKVTECTPALCPSPTNYYY